MIGSMLVFLLFASSLQALISLRQQRQIRELERQVAWLHIRELERPVDPYHRGVQINLEPAR